MSLYKSRHQQEPQTPDKLPADLAARERFFDGFLTLAAWSTLHVAFVVGLLVMIFALGVDWLVSLATVSIVTLVVGRLIHLSSRWTVAVVLQAAIVVLARLLIAFFDVVL